jgi:hypothetical protein
MKIALKPHSRQPKSSIVKTEIRKSFPFKRRGKYYELTEFQQ